MTERTRIGVEVIPEDIEIPEPEQAVATFRKLLSNVANRAGLSPNQLRASDSIYAGDGGVDATVVGADSEKVEGTIIPRGTTGFQIKRSDLRGKKAYKSEVTDGDGELGSSIKRLLEDGGAYRLVVFESPSESMLADRMEGLQEAFEEASYPDADVDVIIGEQLTQEINKYPALVTGLVSSFEAAEDIDTWSRTTDISSIESYVEVLTRTEFIESIRARVESDDSESIIRVTGLPGIGKTRLVFEAVSHEEIEHRVLYTDAERFRGSDLEGQLKADDSLSGVLVIDRCTPDDIERFRRSFEEQTDRLSIITICDQFQSPPYDLHLEPLPDYAIHELLRQATDLSDEEQRSVVSFAMGFPQVAELVAESASDSGFDIEDAIVERLIRNDSIGAGYRSHRRVLEGFALFSRVEWETADGERGPNIDWILEETGFDDEQRLFTEIVRHHQERGVLQGSQVLSIRPFPLVLYLLESWMRQRTPAEVRRAVSQMPPALMTEFRSRVQSAMEFEPGRRWVEDVLAAGGAGASSDEKWAILEIEARSRLFIESDTIDRQETVQVLRQWLPKAPEETLEPLTRGRPPILRALEQIGRWDDTFNPAARTLLDLAAAEPDPDYPATASKLFADFFWWGYGGAATTKTPPTDRLPILADALTEDAERRNAAGIRAASKALPAQRVGPARPSDRQADQQTPDLWTPQTDEERIEEITSYWRGIWELLRGVCADSDRSISVKRRAIDTLLEHAIEMVFASDPFSERVRETLVEAFEYPWSNKPDILRVVNGILECSDDGLSPSEASAWEECLRELSQSTYLRRLYWFVGLDHSMRMADEEQRERLRKLAEEGIETSELDTKEAFQWLVSDHVNNWWSHRFGIEVGRADEEYELIDRVTSILQDDEALESIWFPAGYLHAVSEDDPDRRQTILDDFADNRALRGCFGTFSRLSGANRVDIERILAEVKRGTLGATDVRGFWVRGDKNDIPASLVDELCEALLALTDPEGGPAALELFTMYYVLSDASPPLPQELAVETLTHNAFTDPDFQFENAESHWRQLAMALIETESDQVGAVMSVVLENMAESGMLAGGSREGRKFISRVMATQPDLGWQELAAVLENDDRSSQALTLWLQSGGPRSVPHPVASVRPDQLWDWIDRDPERNARTAALIVPAALPDPAAAVDEFSGLIHEMLVRYGHRDDVRAALHSNHGTRGLHGPLSEVYDKRMDEIDQLREKVTDSNVSQWMDEHEQDLANELEHELAN